MKFFFLFFLFFSFPHAYSAVPKKTTKVEDDCLYAREGMAHVGNHRNLLARLEREKNKKKKRKRKKRGGGQR